MNHSFLSWFETPVNRNPGIGMNLGNTQECILSENRKLWFAAALGLPEGETEALATGVAAGVAAGVFPAERVPAARELVRRLPRLWKQLQNIVANNCCLDNNCAERFADRIITSRAHRL